MEGFVLYYCHAVAQGHCVVGGWGYIVKSGRWTNCHNSEVQCHFLIFAWFFKAKYSTKYAPPRRGKYKVNWRSGFAAPAF